MSHEDLIDEARRHVGAFPLGSPAFSAGAVAAALVSEAGHVYTGVCVDVACGIGFCAEHAAVAAMLGARETVVRRIVAVTADRVLPPCGRCRELLAQVDARNAACEVVLGPDEAVPLADLLPRPWR